MLADTIILAHRRTLFWQVNGDNLLWHVVGNIFLHVDGDNLVWHVDGGNPFGMSTVVLARRIPACTCICIYIYENENANLNVQSHLYVYVICFVSKSVFMEMCMNACM